jgi:hypothetical protein
MELNISPLNVAVDRCDGRHSGWVQLDHLARWQMLRCLAMLATWGVATVVATGVITFRIHLAQAAVRLTVEQQGASMCSGCSFLSGRPALGGVSSMI